MKIIFFTGPPGSGKGTQTLMLCDYLKSKGKKCDVISVGEKLREVQSKESFFSKDLANNLKEGNLVPSVYPISLSLESFIESFEKNTDYILFDGGIRKSVEASLWLEVLKLLPEVEISCIVINVSKEEIKKRLSKRGREDDMAVDKRISLWEGEKGGMQSVTLFEDSAIVKIHYVDGEGSTEEIHKNILDLKII